jgi:hypothetical protein
MPARILHVDLGLNATNVDILDQMRVMKRCREEGFYQNVVCSIRGYHDDPRELYEIPEVRAFCRRLVCQGFVSYLDVSTTLPACNRPEEVQGAWGLFEVWFCSEGRTKRDMVFTREEIMAVLREMDAVILESNARADAALGPLTPVAE